MLSVIIPAYNEEQMIETAAGRVGDILGNAGIEYELVFVDDGSSDGTWEMIKSVAVRTNCGGISRVRGLHFSRNFGKEAAMFAGLAQASGDAVAVMDCDLQHPPEKLPEMYKLWQEGYEVIEGIKESRGEESDVHKYASKLFYKLISSSSGMDMTDSSDFKMLDRKVVDTLNSLTEKNVFFRALSFWSGYRRTTVTYRVAERTAGASKWSTGKLIKYAVNNITSFTSLPLTIITIFGIITLAISVLMGLTTLLQKIYGVSATGFTTVILLILFIGSLIMISLGIIGIYISKIYDEVKGRPRYVISEKI